MDNNTLNNNAVKNPLTAKPVTNLPANNMIDCIDNKQEQTECYNGCW